MFTSTNTYVHHARCSLFAALAMLILTSVGCVSAQNSNVTSHQVNYQHGDVNLQGVLAVRENLKPDHKTPGVLIVHEWWGLNDYAIMRAKQIAAMGYVAFALDMYGEGKHSDNVEDAKAWSSEFYGKPLLAQRAQAGLEAMLKDPRVDPDNIIVMGYCFGGTAAIELAYSGAKLKGAVSFHGTPSAPTDEQAKATHAKLLILTGASDPMFNAQSRQSLQEGLDKTDINWSMVVYGHALHSFTNPGSDKYNIPGVGYNQAADVQSWQALKHFMHVAFDCQHKH